MKLTISVPGVVLAITAMLVIAGIIGYVTAWFYSRSVNTPAIQHLEADKNELNNRISGLKEDNDKLITKVGKLGDKIIRLEERTAKKDKEIKKLSKPKKKLKHNS